MRGIEDFRKSNVDEVKVIEVVQVKSLFGEGTKESIGRQIIEYYTLDGELLSRVDDFDRPAPKERKIYGN